MNWILLGAVVVCLPVFVMFKDKYNRLAIDENNTTSINNQGQR